MLIYVDDIIVASLSNEAIDRLLIQLQKHFAIKDLGELHYFLGIEVTKKGGGISLSQTKYAHDILKKVNMQLCKPISTPMSVSNKLSKTIDKPFSSVEATKYRSTV